MKCTVGQLRKLLAESDLPDNVPVLVTSADHSYRQVICEFGTVMYHRLSCIISQDFGEDLTPEGEEYGRRILALLVF